MYISEKILEKDNEIIGKKTPRYLIGNFYGPSRFDEDIKAFSIFGDFDGLKNVTATGLFSTKYGIFVKPSINIRVKEGDIARKIDIFILGKIQIKPECENLEGPLGPGAYYFPNSKKIDNISYVEAEEVLKYVINKSNGKEIIPISVDEMYSVIENIRKQEFENNQTHKTK